LIDQNLISAGTPLVGGGLLGFATGFAIRKIMKLAFIGLGLLALVLAFLGYKTPYPAAEPLLAPAVGPAAYPGLYTHVPFTQG
jgi:hypothetical protein